MICLIFSLALFNTREAAGVTLVRFGTSAENTAFDLEDWNILLKSSQLDYTERGNGGLIATSDPGEYGDFRGVQGTPRSFSKGERIVVTWYNDSDESFFFTARISFTDANEPNEAFPDGKWLTMRSFTDYRLTYSEIFSRGTAKTVFNITDSGVHKTDSTYALVNINLAIEWGSTYQKQFLICEKIELLDDADIIPPAKPSGLNAIVVSDSKIRLSWDAPEDNIGVVEYLVYRNGEIEGYSQSTDHTCVFLEPATDYTFSVTALDATGNESMASDPVSATTQPDLGREDLIHPAGFEYLGAILVPEDFSWGGEAIAYHSGGDGGQINASDSYPGSLFLTNLNQPENGLVGEIDIPPPLISSGKNPNDLNEASILTNPVNIRPANIDNWDYVDIWRTGLEVVSDEGRLYSSWSIHYTVTGEKHASISCCDISDLAENQKFGAWYLGDPGLPPIDAMMSDWLFSIPQQWADIHCSGRNLVTGRCRDGGLSGLGPTLFAFSRVGTTPPSPDQILDFTTLLKYGSVEGTDNVHFPNAVDGYKHADDWREAMWLTANGQDAIAIIGNKALGHNWYGYHGERMRHDWVIADVPYPDFWETDPDGKGWRSHNRQPMIVLYDPQDLAAVANGSMSSYQPQPYAALRIPKETFYGGDHEIFSAAFDSENQILYAAEFLREWDGRLIVHAWEVNSVSTAIGNGKVRPFEFRLDQNYPNPFNPDATISFALPVRSQVTLEIIDILGRTVKTIVHKTLPPGHYTRQFHANRLSSGVYFYRIKANPIPSGTEFHQVRRMVILK